MGMMGGCLKKECLVTLFNDMNEALLADGKRTDLYVYGGAALVLSDQPRTTTRDVDCYVAPDLCALFKDLSVDLSIKYGIDGYYNSFLGASYCMDARPLLDLNHHDLSNYIAKRPDMFERFAYGASQEALSVHTLKLETQLVFKTLRQRCIAKDMVDMSAMVREFGIRSSDTLLAHCEEYGRDLSENDTANINDRHVGRTWSDLHFYMNRHSL